MEYHDADVVEAAQVVHPDFAAHTGPAAAEAEILAQVGGSGEIGVEFEQPEDLFRLETDVGVDEQKVGGAGSIEEAGDDGVLGMGRMLVL